ncbi:MAG: hypothetical protein ACKVOK_16070 [Flavobacteriales bacterium]
MFPYNLGIPTIRCAIETSKGHTVMQDPGNQGQDKIVAVGYSVGKALVGRYTSEGSVDHEELLQKALAFYSNPPDDFIFASLNCLRTNDDIELYATDGRLVLSRNFQNEISVNETSAIWKEECLC